MTQFNLHPPNNIFESVALNSIAQSYNRVNGYNFGQNRGCKLNCVSKE